MWLLKPGYKGMARLWLEPGYGGVVRLLKPGYGAVAMGWNGSGV